MQRSILSELDKNRLLEGPHAAQTQICDLHKQLMLKEVSPEGNVLRVRTNPLCMCINTKAHAEQDLLREMRDELNDALNEVALLTRIRNEEKRISSERYMQLCATKSQLEAGRVTIISARGCMHKRYVKMGRHTFYTYPNFVCIHTYT
jgi:hypothetical protein